LATILLFHFVRHHVLNCRVFISFFRHRGAAKRCAG
jgi:hypothetical protein